MKAETETEFPSHLPSLPNPPDGHEWKYRGLGAKSKQFGWIAWDRDLGGDKWGRVNDHNFGTPNSNAHYAEAVLINPEPDYSSRDYQKSVLDAAWDGAECECLSLDKDWTPINFIQVAYAANNGKKIRVKPTAVMVPLEWHDWLNGPWYIGTPNVPNVILDLVITFSDVSITVGTHGCEPKLHSIHCSDYGKIWRTKDGVNFEKCEKVKG